MIWQIANNKFDAVKRTVSRAGEVSSLEPKAAMLLIYFCQNAGKIISRDDLIADVWHGQVVSDNAINRVVVLLRKALGDDDKVKQVIATVPKIGYQMVADVKEVSGQAGTIPDIRRKAILAILGSLLLVWLMFTQSTDQVDNSAQQSPLLRQSGIQSDGALSVHGHLAYTHWEDNQSRIDVLLSGESIAQNVTKGLRNVFFPVWSHEGDFLIFVGRNKDGCHVFQVDVKGTQLADATAIHPCQQQFIIGLTLDVNNELIYLAGRDEVFGVNYLRAIERSTGQETAVTQPEVKGMGLHHIDAHPVDSGVLLAVSDEVPGRSYFYKIHVNERRYELIKQLPYHVASAAWAHDGMKVIHPSIHPAYGVMISSQGEGEPEHLLTDSRRVSFPKRHPNGTDYIYTSYLNNRDLMQSGVSLPINSSVMDYLPTVSHGQSQLAFVSKRSGFSEVWVYGFEDQQLFEITPPDRGRTFYDIKWSWDDRYILANTDSGLLLFDVSLRQFTKEWKSADMVYLINWMSVNEFNYSVKGADGWQVIQQSLDQEAPLILDTTADMILSDQVNHHALTRQSVLETEHCHSLIYRRKSTWVVKAGGLVCIDQQSGRVINVNSGLPLSEETVSVSEGYDWLGDELIYSETVEMTSDLMLIKMAN